MCHDESFGLCPVRSTPDLVAPVARNYGVLKLNFTTSLVRNKIFCNEIKLVRGTVHNLFLP